jgi:predicted RNA-binding protein associated with RNAse of E/G family
VDSTTERVRIHYHRLPDRRETYVQHLVARTDDCIVTFLEHTPLAAPVRVHDQIVLEPGSPATWFTFPGRWHDIGLFHRQTGQFTGIYANVLTPVQMLDANTWETTDLFLDVWLGGGPPEILDAEELEEALARHWIDPGLAARARREAETIRAAAVAGEWPPAIVADWPLERVHQAIAQRR